MRRAFFFLGLIMIITLSASGKKDNEALLEELKLSAVLQIGQQQILFNTNNIVGSSDSPVDKPKPVKRMRKKAKKKVDEGC